jgi:hypothetical protein
MISELNARNCCASVDSSSGGDSSCSDTRATRLTRTSSMAPPTAGRHEISSPYFIIATIYEAGADNMLSCLMIHVYIVVLPLCLMIGVCAAWWLCVDIILCNHCLSFVCLTVLKKMKIRDAHD